MCVEGFCQCSFLGISLCLLLFLCAFSGIPVCNNTYVSPYIRRVHDGYVHLLKSNLRRSERRQRRLQPSTTNSIAKTRKQTVMT